MSEVISLHTTLNSEVLAMRAAGDEPAQGGAPASEPSKPAAMKPPRAKPKGLSAADRKARQSLALEASWEIEPMLEILIREEDEAGLVRRSIGLRLLQLNSVIMSIVGGDDMRPTEEMREKVLGPMRLRQ